MITMQPYKVQVFIAVFGSHQQQLLLVKKSPWLSVKAHIVRFAIKNNLLDILEAARDNENHAIRLLAADKLTLPAAIGMAYAISDEAVFRC